MEFDVSHQLPELRYHKLFIAEHGRHGFNGMFVSSEPNILGKKKAGARCGGQFLMSSEKPAVGVQFVRAGFDKLPQFERRARIRCDVGQFLEVPVERRSRDAVLNRIAQRNSRPWELDCEAVRVLVIETNRPKRFEFLPAPRRRSS